MVTFSLRSLVWSEESGALEISLSACRLMGAFNAGVADKAWTDLPMPMLSNQGSFLVHPARMACLQPARGGRGSS